MLKLCDNSGIEMNCKIVLNIFQKTFKLEYIRMCVCMCVCVCIYVCVYIKYYKQYGYYYIQP